MRVLKEEKGEKGTERIFKETMAENFQFDEVQCTYQRNSTPSRIKTIRSTLTHVLLKLLKVTDKEP